MGYDRPYGIDYVVYQSLNTAKVKRMKTIMITGANSGIGYQTALGLAEAGHQVVMVCRNKARGESAQRTIMEKSHNQQVDLIVMDLSSQQSIREGVAEFNGRYQHLDILINNAAVFDITQKTRQLSVDGLETIFATNHLGSFLLTNLLLPKLKNSSSARIINIASKGLLAKPFIDIDFDNLNGEKKFSVADAYYHSKLAQIMFTFELAERLADSSVTVNVICVPAVKLDAGRYDHIPALLRGIYRFKMQFSLSTEEMAKTYIALATDSQYEHITGAYIDENLREVKAPRKGYVQSTWKKLWDVSAKMTGLTI